MVEREKRWFFGSTTLVSRNCFARKSFINDKKKCYILLGRPSHVLKDGGYFDVFTPDKVAETKITNAPRRQIDKDKGKSYCAISKTCVVAKSASVLIVKNFYMEIKRNAKVFIMFPETILETASVIETFKSFSNCKTPQCCWCRRLCIYRYFNASLTST